MTVQIEIMRWDPSSEEEPHFETYDVVLQENMTLLAALKIIQKTLEPSLAFREYHCAKGMCGSCRLRVNGVDRRACETVLEKGKTYRVEPVKGRRIIRDLVYEVGTVPAEGGEPR